MRRPLLYAHMESQKHLNNEIIVNKPRIILRKDGTSTDAIGGNDEIVYLNLNDDDLIIDDEDYSVSFCFHFSGLEISVSATISNFLFALLTGTRRGIYC